MPTVRENIGYIGKRYVEPRSGAIAHYAKVFLVLLAIALALECVLFNVNFFRTLTLEEVSLADVSGLRQDSEGFYLLTEANHTVEFSNLNTPVTDIYIDFDSNQAAQQVELKINFTDDAHQTYFDSTEYTEGVPNVEVSTASDQSKYINLTASGSIGSIRIEVVGDSVSYPIKLTDISINKPHPFTFVVWRFLLAFALLALGYAFRPKSSLYRFMINENPGVSKATIVFTMVAEMAIVTSFLLYGSNLVGVATESYNYGSWDNVSFANTFEVGGENAQQYAELAKAMAHGQLYLDEEPPQWLQDMDNPYDKGARDELQKETGEAYLFDVAYYQGHYYVYFGVVPVVLFYLPFYLLTGANFPSAVGVLFALLAFVAGCTVLLDRFARCHFKRVSLGLYLLLQIPLVMCCGIMYLAKFPTFYSLPIACGLAFSVWGIYFWMKGRAAKTRFGWFLAGSLCMALVAGCRPQLLVLSCLAFPLFWRPYVKERRIATKRGAAEFACLVAPYLVVAAGIMAYNYARFGSFTDFGANYNLTVNDMTKRGWNIGRLAPAVFAYFLQPPNVTGVFPFLQPVDFSTTYMGQTIKEVTFGGVFACLPVLWILAFTVPVIKMRVAKRSTHTIAGVVGVLLVGGVAVALLDAEMAGILQRYYADFSFMFLMATVLLAFIANENLEQGTKLRGYLMKGLLAVVAVSVAYIMLMCFVPETGWYSSVYDWAYQDLLESMLFWT